MKSSKINFNYLISSMLVVLISLLALLGSFWNQPHPELSNKAPHSNSANPSVSTSILLQPDQKSQAQVAEAYGKLPLSFEANCGQTDPAVKFISRGNGYNLFLTDNEAVLTLQKAENPQSATGHPQPAVLRMKLVGAPSQPQVAGLEEQPGRINYFIGNDPKKWRANVATFAKVKYQNVYPGVDLVYYGNQQQLEYDFIVEPGADSDQIRLGFDGAKKLWIDEIGDLVLTTNGGDVRQHKPVVYQEVAGSRKEIAGNYVVKPNGEVGFEIGIYDPSRPLVIDPVLSYSTYLGGIGADVGQSIAVDSVGNAYVIGQTASTNFPTLNAFQGSHAGGSFSENNDAFVTKLSATGGLSYSTYLGGTGYEDGLDIAVDSAGNAHVTGETQSTDFPILNAFQSSIGSRSSAFVTKLTPSGALSYSTYLGGSSGNLGHGIAIDSTGNACIAGYTSSTDFPIVNAFQSSISGNNDAFMAKLTPSGALSYSTYLGGSGDDRGWDIAVDSADNIYVTGATNSINFPTLNAFQPSNGGSNDVFVSKLTAGGALSYSTYLGGGGFDFGEGIAVDLAGNAYITGSTFSTDFPTLNAFQPSPSGSADVFVSKLTPSGALSYSTYLGGSFGDDGYGIAVDTAENAYVTGRTGSINFPTLDAYQAGRSGDRDAFVAKLTPSGMLSYSTYLGGNGTDEGRGIAVDLAGNAYVTGFTSTTNFPTLNAFQGSLANVAGRSDAFVTKIGDEPLNHSPLALCENVTVSAGADCMADASIDNGSDDPDGDSITLSQSPSGPYPLGSTSVTLTVTDSRGTSTTCTATVTVIDSTPPVPGLGTLATVTAQCSATVTPPTATDNCAGTITGTTTDPLTYTSQGTFIVHWTYDDGNGNSSTQTQTVIVQDTTPPTITTFASDKTLSGGANCQAAIPNLISEVVANDNCSLVTITQSPTAGTSAGIGNSSVTIRARDAVGNESTCTATVTILDTTPPIITCPASVNVEGNIQGQCSANVNPGTATASDNCPGMTVVGIRSDEQPLSAPFSLGITTITWNATDAAGNMATCSQTITITNPSPIVTITGPPSGTIYAVGTPVSFTGSYTDNPGGTHTATWTFDSLTQAGTVNETTGGVIATYTFTAAGVYLVTLTVSDGCGGTGTANSVDGLTTMVVVYDPEGGFVTGGGWINSPAGAYTADLSLFGRASFCFVSKYLPGATVPTGNTEFQFRVANFNFKSTSYEWLVIGGAKAQYKGTGTINGSGNYGFILTAIDGQINGGGGVDKFRIKIWDKNNNDAIVYDNKMNAPDSSDPTTVIGGGSIMIHRQQ